MHPGDKVRVVGRRGVFTLAYPTPDGRGWMMYDVDSRSRYFFTSQIRPLKRKARR